MSTQTQFASDSAGVKGRERTWVSQIPLIGVIVLLALAVRLPFFAATPYPLNDGGMFAQILDDLRAHQFVMPRETGYNFEHIPLCYPPLGFYFGALAAALFHQSAMETLRWVPLFFNLLCVPVFFLIALEFLHATWLAFCASCIYVVVPRASEWLIMGGGLTRSPGELFAFIAILLFYRGVSRGHRRSGVWSGVMVGLSLLTHLEAGLFAAVSLAVLALFFTEVRHGAGSLMVAGAAAALLFLPWLLWAMARAGAAPFVSAFLTHGTNGTSGLTLPSGELLPWLFLLGVMAVLAQPAWALWVLAIDVFVSRSAKTHEAVVYALFAGWFLGKIGSELTRPGRLSFHPKVTERPLRFALCGITVLAAAAFSVRYLHLHHQPGDRLADLKLDFRSTLAPAEVAAMDWVRAHTANSAKFLVYDQRSHVWASDLVAEWFPYLAQRQSVDTAQGREWLPDRAFVNTVERMPMVNVGCTHASVQTFVDAAPFDYLFLSGPLDDDHQECAALIRAASGMTDVAYQSDQVTLYAKPGHPAASR